jgi:hypothetical protein
MRLHYAKYQEKTMEDAKKDIWFPARKYGWGWGLPIAWQGWVVFIGYLALLIWGVQVLRHQFSPLEYFFYSVFITAVLIGFCWAKGEKPRWRWGDE